MNPFRGFQAILRKEFIVVLRDKTTLFFMFFPPLVQIIAFGYALDTDVKNMTLVVYDEDRTVESRQFVEALANTETFGVVREVGSMGEVTATLRRGAARVGIQIPPQYTRELRAGRTATVQVLIDGSNSTTALQALNTAIAVAFQQSIRRLLAETGRRTVPIEVRPQMLYNPTMRSPNFFLPGVIGIALQIATVFATAMAIVRERERGTLENLLVSPLSRWGLMLGKLVPYLVLGLTMAVCLFAILRWWFAVPIVGSLLLLGVATVLYVFALLSLGLLLSTWARTMEQALQMGLTLLLPSVFFSGYIFPRETMPWIFYAIGQLLPVTFFLDLTRGVVLKGATFTDYLGHLLVLAGMGLALFLACVARFRRQLT